VRSRWRRLPRLSGQRSNWVDVRLAVIDEQEMRELVIDTWRMFVPKRVAAAHLRGETGEVSALRV
jgi:hypothetical protein